MVLIGNLPAAHIPMKKYNVIVKRISFDLRTRAWQMHYRTIEKNKGYLRPYLSDNHGNTVVASDHPTKYIEPTKPIK